MANSYANVPVLSKLKLGSQVYYLKDFDVRELLDTYGNIVTSNKALNMTKGAEGSENNGIPTVQQIVEYVETSVSGLAGAMHFKGNVASLPAATTDYSDGDVIHVTDSKKEYVVYNGEFLEIGDETGHVLKTLTIAGIDLQDDITKAELQNALELKALAYKDDASVTVDDYATGITGASYTPAGSIQVTLKDAEADTTITSTGKVTATGTVAIAAAADSDEDKFQISGSNAASAVSITPKTTSVIKVKTAGSEPSYTDGSYTAPSVSETTSKFNTDGIKARLATAEEIADDANLAETLIFEAASKADALTATGFDAGSYTAPTYTAGSLPEFEDVTVWNGYDSAEAAAQTFTGGNIKATFTGKSGGDDISVSGTYKKQVVDTDADKTKFTGTAATITPTLDKGNKTITVS